MCRMLHIYSHFVLTEEHITLLGGNINVFTLDLKGGRDTRKHSGSVFLSLASGRADPLSLLVPRRNPHPGVGPPSWTELLVHRERG